MKRCAKCNFNYADDTLEFCLEDGSRLLTVAPIQTEIPTKTFSNLNVSAETSVKLPFSNQAEVLEFDKDKNDQKPTDAVPALKTSILQNNKILEISAVTLALIHNWWQWLYLNNQYYSSFSSYVLSANFLMWLMLLAFGATIGIISLKQSSNKALPIIGLVILSINLLLFLVPKH
jgi:hypothetical protein